MHLSWLTIEPHATSITYARKQEYWGGGVSTRQIFRSLTQWWYKMELVKNSKCNT